MSFNNLIAGKGKGPSEEGRLNILVKTYEQENNELKKQLDISKDLEKDVLKLLEENNKEKFDLQRQVKSLDKNLQIEKKVGEGLLKKGEKSIISLLTLTNLLVISIYSGYL
jgi:hypothetical protein